MRNIFYIAAGCIRIGNSQCSNRNPGCQINLKGKVINDATNEPVAYTNIGIEDTFHGTASDEKGNFELKIPEEMVSGHVFFSSVGYQSQKIRYRHFLIKSLILLNLNLKPTISKK
jgi:hypothetical protein